MSARKAADLKVLQGTGRADRIPHRSALDRLGTVPEVPPHLDGEARKEWASIAGACIALGTLLATDLRALEHATAAGPWVLSTLHAFAEATSLRAAATALRLHHSSFQDRITQAEHLLGWPIRDPHGRLRLQLALALRRLRRHPPA